LSESGDYTEKYNITETLIDTYQKVKLRKPARPAESKKTAYPAIKIQDYLTLEQLYSAVVSKSSNQYRLNCSENLKDIA